MPVTAKLSRAFYEKLGDDVTNELVNWLATRQMTVSNESPTSPSARFNAVDLTYRTELRELNDLNFARFDAKVGERLAELRSEMDARFARAAVTLAERMTELRAEVVTELRAENGRGLPRSRTDSARPMSGSMTGSARSKSGSGKSRTGSAMRRSASSDGCSASGSAPESR